MADDAKSQIKKASKDSSKKKRSKDESVLQKQLANIQQEMVEKGVAREAKEQGVKYIGLSAVPMRSDILHLLTRDEIVSGQLVPFHKIGKELHLACVNPADPETVKILNQLKEKGYDLKVFLSSRQGIEHALNTYDIGMPAKKIVLTTTLDESMLPRRDEGGLNFDRLHEKFLTLASAEALQLIHIAAMKLGSSDIHIQPMGDKAVLRFRMDGILRTVFEIPIQQFEQLAVQIKHNAGVKINVKNIPQDGEYNFEFEDRNVRVRMSTLPTELGESIVFRLLDAKSALTSFDQLGFEEGNMLAFQKSLRTSFGMILVTGPTGSGKTTTLYTSLRSMANSENKVITLEDPMEYAFPDIVQSQIHPDEGYTFEHGLKAILRQDPDIIMIGEIRDFASAETATQAALTGHTVLSTLHTNSAIEAITRLLNMGVKPFVLAPALHTILAQRLVRKLCPDCKVERALQDAERSEIEKVIERIRKVRPELELAVPDAIFDKKGCNSCHHSGYIGRTAITEVLVADEDIRVWISSGISADELKKNILDQKAILLMSEDGMLKVLAGVTSLAEITRAIGS